MRITLTGTTGMVHLDRNLGSARIDETDTGLGLLRMRERVAMVNGTFSMTSPSEGEQKSTFAFPLVESDARLIYGGASESSARTE